VPCPAGKIAVCFGDEAFQGAQTSKDERAAEIRAARSAYDEAVAVIENRCGRVAGAGLQPVAGAEAAPARRAGAGGDLRGYCC
jgi:hypothetical protein